MQITDMNLSDYVTTAYKRYGQAVLEDRALPDLFDGLKPVHRRILYQMHAMGLHPKGASKHGVKSARVVGDVIGHLHPHGDTSIYDGMVTMVNAPRPLVYGHGNWGDRDDGPAASRYTNARLTAYGAACVQAHYLAVTPTMPNYDGQEREPLVLPSLLPNLWLNGARGIAVSVNTHIPPMAPDGVLGVCCELLRGRQVTAKDAAKVIRVDYGDGAKMLLTTPDQRREWVRFWETGAGTIWMGAQSEVDKKGRILTLWGIPLGVGGLDDLVGKITSLDGVDTVRNLGLVPERGSVVFEVKCTGKTWEQDVVPKVMALTTSRTSLMFTAMQRRHRSLDRVEDLQVKIIQGSPLTALQTWCRLRVALEQRALAWLKQQLEQKIQRNTWMLTAASQLDKVLKVVRSSDPEVIANMDGELARVLNITVEGARMILDTPVRRLSTLDKGKHEALAVEHQQAMFDLLVKISDPAAAVVSQLTAVQGDASFFA